MFQFLDIPYELSKYSIFHRNGYNDSVGFQ